MSSVPAPDFETVLEQARKLPPGQRVRLAEALRGADDDPHHEHGALHPDLREELNRRVQSMVDGTAVTVDGRQALRDLRAKFKG